MKKLLSILASVGLVATASTSVVACSNLFNAGSLTVNGANDLNVDMTSQLTGDAANNINSKLKHSLLDQYMTNKSDWRLNNSAYAADIVKAKNAYDHNPTQDNLDALNTSLYSVVVPVFSADGNYSLDAAQLYNNKMANVNPKDMHDKASKTNKLELKVDMIKLGDMLHVIGLDGLKADSLYDFVMVNADAATPINNYVYINYNKLNPVFTQFSKKQLQKIMNRPDKSVKGMRLEIATAPTVVINNTNYWMRSRDKTFTITGQNLNLITPANTKLLLADGKTEIKDSGMTFDAVREDYLSATVTFTKNLGTGDYILQYSPSSDVTLNINLHVTN